MYFGDNKNNGILMSGASIFCCCTRQLNTIRSTPVDLMVCVWDTKGAAPEEQAIGRDHYERAARRGSCWFGMQSHN
jgi:hypothetical protein